ncbi:MAG: phosphate signaling complex protein PhoU [Desulfobacteraceae bacterium]|nr:phosphate signaling complex protein PhoU [Desulfobacteraceae bacterium]
MTIHFQHELEKIKKRILALGSIVEERVRMAVKAIDTDDLPMVEQLINTDYEVDEMEVEIEEECLKVLALYQPVAVDLRFLISVIKINNDLERIADEAVNIAQRVQVIHDSERGAFPFDYATMGEKVQLMLKKSLDAFVNLDLDLAFNVLTRDDEIDAMHRNAYDSAKKTVTEEPHRVKFFMNSYLISRHLERIGDHATNIAEEVIYLIEGQIVRHEKF